MNYTVLEENLGQFNSYWRDNPYQLKWEFPFLLPAWLEVWLKVFAPEQKTTLLAVRQDSEVLGLAPLLIENGTASIIGSPNVCDYFDLPIRPGKESEFYRALLGYLNGHHIKSFTPSIVRPDSSIVLILNKIAEQEGYEVVCEKDEVSLESELPATWEEYLQTLAPKQRHEVKRKIRRLEEAGDINYRFVTEAAAVPEFMDIFLKMFVESRKDKAEFLTHQMDTFFRSILIKMAELGLLRASILEIDGKPVATLAAFDYNDTIYLYNSGYDPEYSSLSVGIISKTFLIKDSIEKGKKRFDFLKGGEQYKYHLGGKEIQLQKCRIDL